MSTVETFRKPLFFDTLEGIHVEAGSNDALRVGQIAVDGIGGIGLDLAGSRIANLPAPTDAADVATKAYVDGVAQGLNLKPACRAASSASIDTLSGLQTIDGVALAEGDRVLLFSQAEYLENGIWVASAGDWHRAEDMAEGQSAAAAFTFVEEGEECANNGYTCINDKGNDAVGGANLTFTQFSAAGVVTPGDGLQKTGNVLSVKSGSRLLQVDSDGVTLMYDQASGLSDNGSGLAINASGGLRADRDAGVLQVNYGNGLTLNNDNQLTAAYDEYTLSADPFLSVIGIHNADFRINGDKTTTAATAADWDTLFGGPASAADAQHTHNEVNGAKATMQSHAISDAAPAGSGVVWSAVADTLAKADPTVDAKARVIGIVSAAGTTGGQAMVVKHGLAKGVLTGATPGAPVFLGTNGALSLTAPSGQSLRLIRAGFAANATDLDVSITDLGKRSA